jgi:hypothetical protein
MPLQYRDFRSFGRAQPIHFGENVFGIRIRGKQTEHHLSLL